MLAQETTISKYSIHPALALITGLNLPKLCCFFFPPLLPSGRSETLDFLPLGCQDMLFHCSRVFKYPTLISPRLIMIPEAFSSPGKYCFKKNIILSPAKLVFFLAPNAIRFHFQNIQFAGQMLIGETPFHRLKFSWGFLQPLPSLWFSHANESTRQIKECFSETFFIFTHLIRSLLCELPKD